jgi:hypothetical protein
LEKRKKSKFKFRYIFILFILFLLYEGWRFFSPVNNYRIRWIDKVEEERKNEVKNLIPETLPKSTRLLKSKITEVDWVGKVTFYKSIKGILTIFIKARNPVALVSNKSGLYIDKEGFLFRSNNIDTLPKIKLHDNLDDSRVKESVHLIMLTRDINIEEFEITSCGLESGIGSSRIIWGIGGYPDKYRILKKILNDRNISNRVIDFRFENQVVLRR